ncbi:MAG: asparagine synthase (glutamine-hydrolyzing) [Planctomycetes bacterium]|nr:asparagine synthase (glutamine-hydrolyzing) [Planctomycetota bacterium]
MCGLCGVAYADPRVRATVPELERSAHTIQHRGPDDFGTWIRGGFGLAFRRLSIIDVAGGHQPFENETGLVGLVGNGEIYNYAELKRELLAKGHRFHSNSDIETLVHLYEEHGDAFPERLVGMYAFALVDLRDERRPKLLLGRDRLGIKPLYWAEDARGIAFGSEPKAILELGFGERRLRREKLLDYLISGYVGGDDAAWSGVKRVPPATTLSWTPGEAPKLRRYWDLPTERLRVPASEDEILELLDRVVRDHLLSDVPLGAFLSGGIDSTAVVDAMARVSKGPVVACSVGFREKSHDELELATRTALRLRAEHHTEILDPDPRLAVDPLAWLYDEPLADPSTVPTFLVSKMARAHVTVALSGDGGDEVFAGYRRYVHDVAENRVRAKLGSGGTKLVGALGAHYPKLDWAPRVLRAKTFLSNVGLDPARAYWNSVSQLSRERALDLLAPELARSLADYDPFEAFERIYRRPAIDDPLYRAQYADFHTYLPDQILAKVDRASMGVSLEVRPPILDHRFVERFAPLPAHEKVRGARGKHAFREALRSRVPSEILDGTKRGFDTPLKAWIRGPLAAPVAEALESLPAEWFARDKLRGLLAEHASGARDHGRTLWSLFVLELWRRRHAVVGLGS